MSGLPRESKRGRRAERSMFDLRAAGPSEISGRAEPEIYHLPIGTGKGTGEKDRKKEFEKDPAPLFGTFRTRRAYTGRERADPAAGKVRGRGRGAKGEQRQTSFLKSGPGALTQAEPFCPLSQGRPVRRLPKVRRQALRGRAPSV